MEQGLSEIRQVASYNGPDKTTLLFKPQATFFLAFLTLNLQKNKMDALPVLDLVKNQPGDKQLWNSPLIIFARASILMKNGLNDQALAVLCQRNNLSQTFTFYYLDYLEGVARLNKLDDSCAIFFERFIAGFRGQNYIRSAYQKLAWKAILHGDSTNYRRLMKMVSTHGTAKVDEDKQAGFEAVENTLPNAVLLRARLLFDGGYYDLSLNELLNNPVKTTVQSRRNLIEYTYRLGRIYHEKGSYTKAIENYRQTVVRGRNEPWYFAANAAYQMGLLFENQGEDARADSAYRVCLSINPREYKTSLHQKAKAGLSRLK
jgi:tetratricopeptide (TPR) repeat protein